MEKKTENITEIRDSFSDSCISLLKEVMIEAFQIEAHLFRAPYDNLSQIDHGIRSMIWPDYYAGEILTPVMVPTPDKRMFIVKSNLGFYNIIAYLTFGQLPEFVSVGPFRAEEYTSDYLMKIIGEKDTSDQALLLRSFYQNLPYVSLPAVMNVTKRILAVYYPEFTDAMPISVSFSGEDHSVRINTELMQEFSVEMAERYHQTLLRLLQAVKEGQLNQANKEVQFFLQKVKITSVKNIAEYKRDLNLLNGYCHTAMLETSVHPVYSLRQYMTLRQKIYNSNSEETLRSIPHEICHKYCLLVKNYSYPEYSRTIRDVVNYIRLHLEEDLSLAHIAEHFQKNPTSLSSKFSKEVGMSITDCIHKIRINEAIRYFNTTQCSVSEVALAVGFQDFAYFSRLFRKQIGCSPREYCRSIRPGGEEGGSGAGQRGTANIQSST